MESININVTTEQKVFLNSIDNYSDYIRSAIELKRGKLEKSLTELELEELELAKQLELKRQQIEELITNKLLHNENLRVAEETELKEKQAKQLKDDTEFMAKWSPILNNYPELVTTDLSDVTLTMPLIEKLFMDGHRIGVTQLRKFVLLLKK